MIKNDEDLNLSMDYRILIYAPNIIGYIRLGLVFAAFYNISSPELFLILYSSSIILDFFDGWIARKFNQTSLFGAWLDVTIDNLGRGLLWVHLHPVFYIITVVEWTAFVCNYHLGPDWRQYLAAQNLKNSSQQTFETPKFISRILANNFRNFWGVWAISGLHVLPVWIFGIQENIFFTHLAFLPNWTGITGLIVLTIGRAICLLAELGTIWMHVRTLLVKSVTPEN